MPEGPEVKRVAYVLNKALSGKYVMNIEVKQGGKCNIDSLPSCHLIHYVLSYGKKVIFTLTNARGEAKYFISSLGMEGRWVWQVEKHSNVVLTIGYKLKQYIVEEKLLYFSDTRHFGSLVYANDLSSLNKLGPDLLTDDSNKQLSVKQLQDIYLKRKYKDKQICQVMLDQEAVAGIGNYLKSEILYRSRIRPTRTPSSLEEKEWILLREEMYKTIWESYLSNGLTIRSYISPDGEKGLYKHQIYNKKEDPLGYKVIKETLKDGRSTFWVAEVQK